MIRIIVGPDYETVSNKTLFLKWLQLRKYKPNEKLFIEAFIEREMEIYLRHHFYAQGPLDFSPPWMPSIKPTHDHLIWNVAKLTNILVSFQTKTISNRKRILSKFIINSYHDKLLNAGVLRKDNNENDTSIGKAKLHSAPIIAIVIKEISNISNIPESSVFDQVRKQWRLKKPKLNHYKLTKSKKFAYYQEFVKTLLS